MIAVTKMKSNSGAWKHVLVLSTDDVKEILTKKDFTGIFTALKCIDDDTWREFPNTNAVEPSGQPPEEVSVSDSPELLGSFEVTIEDTIKV